MKKIHPVKAWAVFHNGKMQLDQIRPRKDWALFAYGGKLPGKDHVMHGFVTCHPVEIRPIKPKRKGGRG